MDNAHGMHRSLKYLLLFFTKKSNLQAKNLC